MDPNLSLQLLDDAYETFRTSRITSSYDWKITRDGIDIYVEMQNRKTGTPYLLRIRCTDFPVHPPSYQFVDPATKLPSWPHFPRGTAFKERWLGICINGTLEFYELGHRNRRQDWSYEKHPFAKVTQEIQVLMER